MRVSVIVHPNAKSEKVEKDLLGTIHVWVHAPPLEGKANNAVREVLAEYFQVPKNAVILHSGDKSKNKIFDIVEK